MRFPPRVRSTLDWLYTLLRNPHFWGGMGGLFILAVVAYFLIDAVIMPSYTRHGVSVRVPNVEGQQFELAAKRVENRDLQVRREVGRYNPRVDLGTVVDQNPPPKAKVKPDRRVYLTVNAGEIPMVNVPNLNGISVREAKNRITALGLTVGTVQPDSIPAPYPNTITRQKPSPGDSLETGETVDLWYSTGLGTDTVRVPNVVGLSVHEGRQYLLRQKLRAIVVDPVRLERDTSSQEPDSTDVRRFVQRQGRRPNTTVRAGTEIRLFVTKDSTAVPPVDTTQQDTLRGNP